MENWLSRKMEHQQILLCQFVCGMTAILLAEHNKMVSTKLQSYFLLISCSGVGPKRKSVYQNQEHLTN